MLGTSTVALLVPKSGATVARQGLMWWWFWIHNHRVIIPFRLRQRTRSTFISTRGLNVGNQRQRRRRHKFTRAQEISPRVTKCKHILNVEDRRDGHLSRSIQSFAIYIDAKSRCDPSRPQLTITPWATECSRPVSAYPEWTNVLAPVGLSVLGKLTAAVSLWLFTAPHPCRGPLRREDAL